MDVEASPDPGTTPSTVSWHVIVWILVTLAISSMAQPAGRHGTTADTQRFRIYLCSSPFMCLAGALSVLIEMIWTCRKLNLWPTKAARLLQYDRSHPLEDAEPTDANGFGHTTWPRFIFFVIGTAPAIVKLASFSGVPWSKALGLTFASSYVVNEGFLLLAKVESGKPPSSLAEALGHTETEWALETDQDLGKRIKNMFSQHQLLEESLSTVAYLCQVLFWVWAIYGIWQPSWLLTTLPFDVSTIHSWLDNAVLCFYGAMLGLQVLKTVVGYWWPIVHRFPKPWTIMEWVLICMVDVVLPQPANHVQEQFLGIFKFGGVMFLIVIRFGIEVLSRGLVAGCQKMPRISKVLLMRQDLAETSEDKEQTEQRTKRAERPSDEKDVEKVVFFCLNIGLCVLWYANKYNPTGTVNPAWTDVFG